MTTSTQPAANQTPTDQKQTPPCLMCRTEHACAMCNAIGSKGRWLAIALLMLVVVGIAIWYYAA